MAALSPCNTPRSVWVQTILLLKLYADSNTLLTRVLLLDSAGAGFGLYFSFFIVLHLCRLAPLVWKVVACLHCVGWSSSRIAAQPTLCALSDNCSANACACLFAFHVCCSECFFPFFRSLALGHFYLNSTTGFSRFVFQICCFSDSGGMFCSHLFVLLARIQKVKQFGELYSVFTAEVGF